MSDLKDEDVNAVAKAIAKGMGLRQHGAWSLCIRAAELAIRAWQDREAPRGPHTPELIGKSARQIIVDDPHKEASK